MHLVLLLVVAAVDAVAQSRPVPRFEVDPGWLKLPQGWVLGQVSRSASDAQDHLWVLHRPRSVRAGQKTGPPVLEFDDRGNYLRGWGGAGDGFDWPESEIDRWCLAAGQGCGNGETAASVAFSADPEQRFLYAASRSPARIWIVDRQSLELLDSFGRPGVAPGEFNVLHHMTTDSKGNLYTAEVQDGRRLQRFVFNGLLEARR